MNRLAVSRWALAGLVMWAMGSAACAQERDPVNRVQADALDKAFFVGDLADPKDDPEFYSRNYIVDASATMNQLGVGSGGHPDRIRWEITEDMLIGHKAYALVQGQDCKGARPGDTAGNGTPCEATRTPNGTIVSAYRIRSHFDIRRDYNAQTGEENNVISENTTDRPWNQRQYMRVDWSRNMVANPMEDSLWRGPIFRLFTVTPVSHAVTDPEAEDAPHFETEKGYFDITNVYSITPDGANNGVPTCFRIGQATGSATYECDAQEATVRQSYMKVDPNNDFEPLENTKTNQDVVGNPGGLGESGSVSTAGNGRQRWDPQYGFTDKGYVKFAYIHNNWKKSHQAAACTDNADTNGDGSADQCENGKTGYTGNNGSQCDIYTKKCTIPYRDRAVKPIAYHVNKEAPDNLLDVLGADGKPVERGPLEDVVYSFNQLMSVALATAREVECRRTGDGSREKCHSEFFESTSDPKTKQMVSYGGWLTDKPREKTPALTFCHNPVRSYDLTESCGDVGYKARVGDLRHNFIFYWPHASRARWGGIANWKADPLTGQILGAAAQVMGRSAASSAAQTRDAIQLAMGDLKIEDITGGVPQSMYTRALSSGNLPPPQYTAQEIDQKVANAQASLGDMQSHLGIPSPSGSEAEQTAASQRQEIDHALKGEPNVTYFDQSIQEYDSLAKTLYGSKYEAQMVDSNWLVSAVGLHPGTKLDENMMEFASPLRGMDPGHRMALRDDIEATNRTQGICFHDNEAPASGAVVSSSLAKHFKQKYAGMTVKERGDAIYEEVFKDIVKGITLHEFGHSLGMLHQFASSWDSPNYAPQYWQLRTNEGRSTVSCKKEPRQVGLPDSCMGPRYIDPETPDELGTADESRPNILYFASTSTMEYTYERFAETFGNGTYDQHAMKALYGRVLETFDDSIIPQPQQQAFRRKHASQLGDTEYYQDEDTGFAALHYTELARRMKVFDPARDCRPATAEEKKTAGWRIVHGQVCSPPVRDHWTWKDFASDALFPENPTQTAPYWHVKTREGKHLVRWPYRWGQSKATYAHVNAGDAGADFYEVAVNVAKKFDIDYPFRYFRRGRREYSSGGIASGVASDFLQQMRSYHWQIASRLMDASPARLANDNDLKPIVMAQSEIYKFFTKVVLMPEPGDYYDATKMADPTHAPVDQLNQIFDIGTPKDVKPAFTLGIGDGRYLATDFDNNIGGAWDYQSFVNYTGFSAEKGLAMQALLDGRPVLSSVNRDNTLDGRKVRLNFRTDLPLAVDRLVGGLLADDWETVAMNTAPTDGEALQPLDLTLRSEPKRAPNTKIIYPNVGYRTQLPAIIYTMLFSRMNTDSTLINKMRMCIEGTECRIAASDAKIKFIDPRSGTVYFARREGNERVNGKDVDKGIASRMLQHANALRTKAYINQVDSAGNPVLDATGYPAPRTPLTPRDANNRKDVREFEDYVGLIDAIREIELMLNRAPQH